VPWKEATTMSLRTEFVMLARAKDANMRELCRRYHISPKTGYKWLHRSEHDGLAALSDLSRRPHTSPSRTVPTIEAQVLSIRDQHPAWGPRKIKAKLPKDPQFDHLAVSTIAVILKRNNRIDPIEAAKHHPYKRFEAAAPNDLWQMDFKGYFSMTDGARCYPLTVLDDHSRFLIGLKACSNQRGTLVQRHLTTLFQLYGLPQRMLIDNGAPWGSCGSDQKFTALTAWLLRLGIASSHSRVCHPQTLGKDERLHRTLKAELLQRHQFLNLEHSQSHFDPWRDEYNLERPHEALGMAVPATRYSASPRAFPSVLPPIEYDSDCLVRMVQDKGEIWFQGQPYPVSDAFIGHPVGLKPTDIDGTFDVIFCRHKVGEINLRPREPKIEL
jgi:transposase InsO family protein